MIWNVQACEVELRKYLALEQAVNVIPPANAIGSLWIETTALQSNLKAEAAAWKAQYAENMHKKGKDELQVRMFPLT